MPTVVSITQAGDSITLVFNPHEMVAKHIKDLSTLLQERKLVEGIDFIDTIKRGETGRTEFNILPIHPNFIGRTRMAVLKFLNDRGYNVTVKITS